jgi:hypothetical protein
MSGANPILLKAENGPHSSHLFSLGVKGGTMLAKFLAASSGQSMLLRDFATGAASTVVVITLFISVPVKRSYLRHSFLSFL